jgi:hypothetical protein
MATRADDEERGHRAPARFHLYEYRVNQALGQDEQLVPLELCFGGAQLV